MIWKQTPAQSPEKPPAPAVAVKSIPSAPRSRKRRCSTACAASRGRCADRELLSSHIHGCVARDLRELDVKIQSLNWTTDLMEA